MWNTTVLSYGIVGVWVLFLGLGVVDTIRKSREDKDKEKAKAKGKRDDDDDDNPPLSGIIGWNADRFKHFAWHFAHVCLLNAFVVELMTVFKAGGLCILGSFAISVVIAGILTKRTSPPLHTERRYKRRERDIFRVEGAIFRVTNLRVLILYTLNVWIYWTMPYFLCLIAFVANASSDLLRQQISDQGSIRFSDHEAMITTYLPWAVALALTFDVDWETFHIWAIEKETRFYKRVDAKRD
jgi:hypothetical protein